MWGSGIVRRVFPWLLVTFGFRLHVEDYPELMVSRPPDPTIVVGPLAAGSLRVPSARLFYCSPASASSPGPPGAGVDGVAAASEYPSGPRAGSAAIGDCYAGQHETGDAGHLVGVTQIGDREDCARGQQAVSSRLAISRTRMRRPSTAWSPSVAVAGDRARRRKCDRCRGSGFGPPG